MGKRLASLKHKRTSRLLMGKRLASLKHKKRFEFEREATLNRGNINKLSQFEWESPQGAEAARKFDARVPWDAGACKIGSNFNGVVSTTYSPI